MLWESAEEMTTRVHNIRTERTLVTELGRVCPSDLLCNGFLLPSESLITTHVRVSN